MSDALTSLVARQYRDERDRQERARAPKLAVIHPATPPASDPDNYGAQAPFDDAPPIEDADVGPAAGPDGALDGAPINEWSKPPPIDANPYDTRGKGSTDAAVISPRAPYDIARLFQDSRRSAAPSSRMFLRMERLLMAGSRRGQIARGALCVPRRVSDES